jgi:putative sigma-54 modulation protein
MNFILTTHNLTLTKAIEDRILRHIEKIEHMNSRLIEARVILDQDSAKTPAKRFGCSIKLGVKGPDLFAEDRAEHLYVAIDRVAKKIEQQVRKRHSITRNRKHSDAARLKIDRQEKAE